MCVRKHKFYHIILSPFSHCLHLLFAFKVDMIMLCDGNICEYIVMMYILNMYVHIDKGRRGGGILGYTMDCMARCYIMCVLWGVYDYIFLFSFSLSLMFFFWFFRMRRYGRVVSHCVFQSSKRGFAFSFIH